MSFWCYMHMRLFGKKGAPWPPEGPQSNMVIRFFDSWRHSICLLRFQSPTVKDIQKGNTEVAQRNQAADQVAKRAALENHDLIGVTTLVPQINLPETPSYTEGETLKTKSEGFQEDYMGWFQKDGLLFLPGNLQWKLVNSLHAATHLGGKALQRLLERSFRGTDLQTTIRQVVSSCPTCQLNNPQGARRPQLAQPVQWHGSYPGEDWQMDFTQIPVSQGYKYLLVMINTFTGWIEGFPIRTEKAEEVVKKTAPWNHSEIWSAQVITKWQWDIIYF